MARFLFHFPAAVLVVWASILLALFPNAVYPEEPQEKKMVLSLAELIRMAIERSPELGEARSEIGAARSDLEQVQAAYYPQLESRAMFGPVPDAKEPLIRDGRITDPSPSLSLSSIGVFGRLDLTATQPLYTFGKLTNLKEAASRGVRAKEFRVEEIKAQIALKVQELYYALVLAREGLEAVQEAEDFFSDAAARMRRLLQLGSANVKESDLYRVDAYRADTLRSKAEAEKGARVSSFALKVLVLLPPHVDLQPAEKTLAPPREGMAGLEKFLSAAAAQRPELKQLAAALAAQDFQVRAAQSDFFPSLFAALQGSLAKAPGREALYNRYIPDEFNHAYVGVVGGLKWNFDFGITRAKLARTRAEYEKLLFTKAAAEMNIPIQVAKSYQDHLEWREAARTYQQAAAASRRWVFAAIADFDAGVGTADEMMRAIEKYGQNRGKYIEALFRFHLSRAELEYASGVKTW